MQASQPISYTPDQVTELLTALTCPDTIKIKQATAMLKPYFKTVEALSNLIYLLANSPDQQIRQLSCVYLRKLITNLWSLLSADDQNKAKFLLLDQYVKEPVTIVKRSIADVIGNLSKLLIPNKEWNELFQFVFQYTSDPALVNKELAMMLLSVIIEYFSINEINTYYESLNPIIESYL